MIRATLVLLFAVPVVAQEPPLPTGAVARIGSTRMRHTGWIETLVYSTDGKWLATADHNGVILVHDAATGRLRQRFTVPRPPRDRDGPTSEDDDSDYVSAVQFSSDGRFLYVGARNTLRAFRLDTGERTFKIPLAEKCLAVSPELVVAADGDPLAILELDPANGHTRRYQTFKDATAWQAKFTRHGILLTNTEAVHLIDPADGKQRGVWNWRGAGDVVSAALAPDGGTLAAIISVSEWRPKSLVLWDRGESQRHRTVSTVSDPGLVAFAPNGKSLAVACHAGLVLIDPTDGKVLRTMDKSSYTKHLTFPPGGAALAASNEFGIAQWDPDTGRQLPASAEPASAVGQLQFLDHRRLRVFAGVEITDYDWRTGLALKRRLLPPVSRQGTTELSPDGTSICACDGHFVRVLDAQTGQERRSINFEASRIAFSPDGQRLYLFGRTGCQVVDDKLGVIRDGRTGAESRLFKDEGDRPKTLSPDGRIIAGTVDLAGRFEDGDFMRTAVRLWDSGTGAKIRDSATESAIINPFMFSRDGRRLAAFCLSFPKSDSSKSLRSEHAIAVWDVATLKRVCTVDSLSPGGFGFAISPDGRSVAVVRGGAVELREVATGALRARFAGHAADVWSMAFSSDGRYLASAGNDGPIYVWDAWTAPCGPAPAPGKLWAELVADKTAYVAMQRLAAAPDQAVALLRDRVRPAAPIAEDRLRKLLEELDDRSFAKRTAAANELRRQVDVASPALKKHAAAPTTSAEVRGQIRRLLDQLDEPNAELNLRLRVLEVLERIDTPAARKLVAEYAAGAAAARFTREARLVLERMKR